MRAEEEAPGTFSASRRYSDRLATRVKLSIHRRHRHLARLADEAEDEGRAGAVIDLVRRAHLFDPALAHDAEPVGQFQRLFLIVRDEYGGVTGALVDFAQPPAQLAADLGIESAKGFVEQQDARFDRKGARQGDPLALTAG